MMLVRSARFTGIVLMVTLQLLSACAVTTEKKDVGPTLGDILPFWTPDTGREIPTAGIDQVLEQYQFALASTLAPELRRQVELRLSDLQMQRSEQCQFEDASAKCEFDSAAQLYQALLATAPNRPDNDRLLYQLARAYDLDGRIEQSAEVLSRLVAQYPNSEYTIEARFRLGETLFSQQQYALAEQQYAKVIAAGDGGAYFDNALYMHGWSLFKQTRYQASLASFTQVLDRRVPDSGDIDQLPRAELEVTEDTLRVMSLAFSYMGGAESIGQYYASRGTRSYEYYLYASLAKLYLEKQRYRDSAETYAAYAQLYPDSDYALEFSVLLIGVYQAGSFPSEILPAKEAFVRRYGIHSQYWSASDEAAHQQLLPQLHQYLDELATHYHATAQAMQKDLDVSTSSTAVPQQKIRDNYLAASAWYAEFVETFPEDEKTSELVFLMAESLHEAGELQQAITAYERVAYDFGDPARGPDAAYFSILAYDQHAASLSGPKLDTWRGKKIDSELLFAQTYPGDPRTPAVLTQAAEELLQVGDAQGAIAIAEKVTESQSTVASVSLRTAWLVQAQGNFQLANYGAAERAYSRALLLMAADDDANAATVDRLAASVYKQAETHLAEADDTQAIEDFLRIASVAAGSSIAAKAHYDAANRLMELESWARAEQEFEDFRSRYPQHALAITIPAKLVHIHQQQGHWRQAGDELTRIAAQDEDAQVRRQSLYMAAEYYEKGGDAALAIERYTQYTSDWPQPFELATEARYRLSEIFREQEDAENRHYWLQQLITSNDNAGAQATERSLYLAAMSSAVFADDAYQSYRNIRLQLPLKQSLQAKRAGMKATLAAYDTVLDYEVAEFVTQASYRIGDVYASLSSDLMDSQRPRELNALELEQYELLLEEQAYPFEEKAIAIHETNARRSWGGVYDQWVRLSIDDLGKLLPARYGKSETLVRYSNDIY